MIKCIVIEDQEPAQRILKKYISDVDDMQLMEIFNNALTALDYLKKNRIDLIFLDIHLPKLSGMDFLAILNPKPYVILTTAFPDYALKSYDFDVSDYLLKPIPFERFIKAVIKVKNQMGILESTNARGGDRKRSESILIKEGYDIINLKFSEILFIKSDGDYTQIHTPNHKHLVSYALKFWQSHLPEKTFLQVHRSYIINTQFIQKVTAGKIIIDTMEIPIGRVYKKNLQSFFDDSCI